MTLRVGLVGCGAIARRVHLPGLRAAGADVVAFASRTPASSDAARAEWGSGVAVGDWRALVDRDDVDAVDVCTPNHLHADIAVAAAAAGKHVLVEKPMACTVADADRMMAAAADGGVVLLPAHNLRFVAPFAAMAGAVAGGAVGTVHGFRAAFGHAGPETWAPDATWFRDVARSGGGALLDLGVHMIDTLRAVTGDDVTEVAAMVEGGSPGVEDAAVVLLRLAGGAVGTLHASWHARPGPDHQLTLFGTDGTLHLDGRTQPTVFPAGGGEAQRLDLPSPADDPFHAFVRAVDGGPSPVTAADGRAAVAVVCAAYEAAKVGTTVKVQ